MKSRLLNLLAALSLLLWAVVAALWITGTVRERQSTVWRAWARPERTFFVRVERQHLIVSDQQMVPSGMPAEYTVDSTRFREFKVRGPLLPNGAGTEMSPDYFALNPTGARFRKLRLRPGGVTMQDATGAVAWRVAGYYGAVEFPWWSLLVVFSLLPAARWAARHWRRSKARRGLCASCGYDLRATPDRCPECGATAAGMNPA